MKLKNKTAIITGAGSGMGKAIAILFAEKGANVIVSDIDKNAIDVVVQEITAEGGKAKGVLTNVTAQGDVDTVTSAAVNEFGSLDILVNNAGIMDNFKTVTETDDSLWDRVMAVNLSGPFRMSRAAIKVMEKQENGGVIINIASVAGLFGTRGGAAYVASKHGLIGLTKNMAATYGTFGKIRVNAIAPGGVETNIGSTITEPSELGFKALQEAGFAPSANPNQIARIVLFLASGESDFVNGAIIVADGGWTAR